MFLRLHFFTAAIVVILLVMISPARGADPVAKGFDVPQELPAGLRKLHIAVVDFVPMPVVELEGAKPHLLVFTDEFFSKAPERENIVGGFLPADYREMYRAALRQAATRHGLSVTLADNLHEIPADTDLIVFGSSTVLMCAGSEAVAYFFVSLIDAKTMKRIAAQKIRHDLTTSGLPWIVNRPVHTVGYHANDFHPQRALLGFAAYACVMDMFKWIGGEVR